METLSQDRNLTLYVGIDVHKKQWSVSIFTDAAHHRTFSQPPSPQAAVNMTGKVGFPTAVINHYEAPWWNVPGQPLQKDPVMLTRYNELKQRLTGKRAIVVHCQETDLTNLLGIEKPNSLSGGIRELERIYD